MKKINIKLPDPKLIKNIETLIDHRVPKIKTIIKVTQEIYYELYETDEKELEEVVNEWFIEYGSSGHAYRDGSKLPFANLKKIEILERK